MISHRRPSSSNRSSSRGSSLLGSSPCNINESLLSLSWPSSFAMVLSIMWPFGGFGSSSTWSETNFDG